MLMWCPSYKLLLSKDDAITGGPDPNAEGSSIPQNYCRAGSRSLYIWAGERSSMLSSSCWVGASFTEPASEVTVGVQSTDMVVIKHRKSLGKTQRRSTESLTQEGDA